MSFEVQTSPVRCATTRRGTAYLEIVSYGNKLRVQRTEAGRALNPFWTIWLRELLLDKTDPKHGFGVELRGSVVLVSSNTTQQGLIETVRAFASMIKPLPKPPISRRTWITRREMAWEAEVDVSECLQSLRLPGKTKLNVSSHYIGLFRDSRNPFKMGQLALMVEYHVARYLPVT